MELTLADIVDRLDALDPDEVIFAREPWTPSSVAVLCRVRDDESDEPPSMRERGLRYFLEVEFAQEFVRGLRRGGMAPTDFCKRLIYFAEYDA